MPIQIIPAAKSFGGEFAKRFGAGAGESFSKAITHINDRKRMDQENESLGIPKGTYNPDLRKAYLVERMKGENKEALIDKRLESVKKMIGRNPEQGSSQDFMSQIIGDRLEKVNPPFLPNEQSPQMRQKGQNFDVRQIPDETIAEITAVDNQLGNSIQRMKDVALREDRADKKAQRLEFEGERTYHTNLAKDTIKEADNLRSSLPKKQMALDFARNAIETGDLSFFSADKLADITGSDLFRTSKGAQLVTAGKENLLSNISKVSSRGQNLWFEQRLNSMFPKIGQSDEANLTVQEMLEGEVALDQAYLNEFDRLSEEDNQKYGFEKKDIKKRAMNNIKPQEKEILARTSYRMKEIEEKEKGLSGLKKQIGKNVTKGTPLTLAMARLYKDKFGENGLHMAKKNGYSIPTLEEFKIYQSRPREFREEISQ